MKAEGRNFDCTKCPESTQKRRRCREERENFTEQDDPAVFPMYVEQGGELYGFCPSKATWNPQLVDLCKLLMITAETGAMLNQGGLTDQPEWFIESLGWFLPKYQISKLNMIAKMFVGDGKTKGKKSDGLKGSQPPPPRKALSGNHNR